MNNLSKIFDYSLIKARLRIEPTEKRGAPYKSETCITAISIKRHFQGPSVKEILKQPDSLKQPIRDKILNKAPQRTRREYSWQLMPEWWCNNNCSDFEAVFDSNVSSWRIKFFKLRKL